MLPLAGCRPDGAAGEGSAELADGEEVATEPGDRASASDGAGSARVEPATPVEAGSTGSWTITYTAAGAGIAAGGGVVLQVSPFWRWSSPQTTNPDYPGYTTVRCSARGVRLETGVSNLHYLVAGVRDRPLPAGETITFVYGDTGGGAHPGGAARADLYAERGEHFFIKVDGDGDDFFAGIAEHPALDILAREPVGFFATADSWVHPGDPFRLTVAALDPVWNRAERFRGRVELDLPEGLEVVEGASGPFTEEERGARSWRLRAPREGLFRVTARDPDGMLGEGRSNTIFCGPMLNEYRLFWADLHGHTRLSDGSGSPEEYLAYGRDVAGLDACAITDHDAHGIQPLDENPALFEHLRRVTEQFHQPGRYVTFSGYEWTSWTFGHKHVLFLHPAEAILLAFRNPRSDTPEKLWAALEGRQAMTLSHHPGGGPIAADWDHADPRMEPLVEMCSVHGSSEFYDCPRGIYKPVPGRSAQDALSRGLRLGWLASGDSHTGHPGTRDPSAATHGLAGIYATGLSREEIWAALQARRVFGTSGRRIVLNFLVNGTLMGGEAAVEEADRPRLLMGMAVGEEDLESLEVIKNNQVLLVEKGEGSPLKKLAAVDESPAADGDFYYLRVTQTDGEQAWSSPVWIKLGPGAAGGAAEGAAGEAAGAAIKGNAAGAAGGEAD